MRKRKKSKVFDLDSVQLDLFEQPKKEWEKHGFATREQWIKAKEYDRAFRHMKQANLERLATKYKDVKRPKLFRAFRKRLRELFQDDKT